MPDPLTGSLFDDTPETAVALTSVLTGRRPASPAEAAFHRFAARIEAVRGELAQWQAYAVRFNQRLAGEHVPTRAALLESQRALARTIDELLGAPAGTARLRRGERKKLRHLLLQLVSGVLEDVKDPELEGLHDKYSDHTHEELGSTQVELAQAMLKDVFGVDLGDDHGAKRPEELFERARHAMDERAARERGRPDPPNSRPNSRRARAQAAKAEAREAERQTAAREVGQSLRDIYRKLVSALHPDREPDPAARDRKTGLMQRVNQAYEKDDLLALLGLQLEIEQIDAAHLASIPPPRLEHYNQILREQLEGLEAELERCVAPYRGPLGPAGRGKVTPTLVDRQLSAEIAELKTTIRSLDAERLAFLDPERRTAALRGSRVEAEEEEWEADDPLFDVVFEPKRRRGRRRR
jgi:hypothetical protein